MHKDDTISRNNNKVYSSLRFLLPFIPIFFGVFYWLEGFRYFIRNSEGIYVVEFTFLVFWFLTIYYLFKKFIRINALSKILVLFIAFSISLKFYVLIMYNNISDFCLDIVSPTYQTDIFIIRLSSSMSILGVIVMILGIVSPYFEAELNYLTNIARIKNRETKTRYFFLEIWASFPIFIGIYNIFFLFFRIFNNFCHVLPFIYAVIISLPWIILMIFFIIYTSVVGLKK
ncbi:MAG: hypothetical protein ACFFB8_15950 [Promethearchaeota archaeon]